MKKFFNIIKGYLGIILIIVALLGIYYWENFGREQFLYAEVLAFNESVDKNTVITEELLNKNIKLLKIDQANIVDDPVTNIKELIGLETKHFIPKNAQLSKKYFDAAEIVLDEEQYIFAIPKDFLIGYPSTLRRKDTVYFYKVKKSNTVDGIDYENLIKTKVADFVLSTTVAYVKDSSNKEVVSIDNDRLDASAKIEEIEIIVTKEIVKKLNDIYESGYQFILVYQE